VRRTPFRANSPPTAAQVSTSASPTKTRRGWRRPPRSLRPAVVSLRAARRSRSVPPDWSSGRSVLVRAPFDRTAIGMNAW
jgi:hypothetical protein